jgi:predicted nucleic acid-binding protein
MTSGYQAVIDACVLVNAALRETLLRLAGPPLLFLPRWSLEIIDETTRTLQGKLGYTKTQTASLENMLRVHFPEAWVTGYEALIPSMTNDPKDRHVLAAAVRTNAQTIVTFNLKDFPKDALDPWDVQAQHPDAFLQDQYHLAPDEVVKRIHSQAASIPGGIDRLFSILDRSVPEFVNFARMHVSYADPEAALVAKLLSAK